MMDKKHIGNYFILEKYRILEEYIAELQNFKDHKYTSYEFLFRQWNLDYDRFLEDKETVTAADIEDYLYSLKKI